MRLTLGFTVNRYNFSEEDKKRLTDFFERFLDGGNNRLLKLNQDESEA